MPAQSARLRPADVDGAESQGMARFSPKDGLAPTHGTISARARITADIETAGRSS